MLSSLASLRSCRTLLPFPSQIHLSSFVHRFVTKPTIPEFDTKTPNPHLSPPSFDHETVRETLSCYGNDWRRALEFFEWIETETKLRHTTQTFNRMIDILGKFFEFDLAWDLVHRMQKIPFSMPDHATFRIMFKRYVSAHLVKEAISTYDRLHEFNLKDEISFCNLIDALCEYKHVIEAQELWLGKNTGMVPNGFNLNETKIHNMILRGWLKMGWWGKCREFWEEMDKKGVTKDLHSYSIYMDIMCKSGKPWKAVKLYKEMKKKRMKLDVVAYNIVIQARGLSEGVDFGIRVFREMRELGCEPNVVTYNMIIKLFCENGRMKEAYAMLNEMPKKSCLPNAVTYHCFFGHLEKPREILRLFDRMIESGVQPRMDTYVMLMRKFGRWGFLRPVFIVWKKMEQLGCSPDEFAYNALIDALVQKGMLDMARMYEEEMLAKAATCSGTIVSSKMFDMVLLQCGPESGLPEALRNGTTTNAPQNDHVVVSNGGKYNRKKQGGKKDAVDLRTLLTLCAQAVAADDRRLANELLKQIRQHSSPMGDGMQRMAHYFADGLEARLAGSGTQVYTAFITKPVSAADVLKGYHLFMAACPFRKLSNFFANKTIMNVAEKATRLHIIDFGILYGFQWPCLIQRLSSRVGGPPRLRITGIDLPQPGFRPAERVEETGRRLANYAETFRVPFGFNAIAQKWDTIKIEDLKIESDEVLVVNCLYRFRNLLDETVVADSPRNKVLNLIRDMNPEVFVQGIVNGAYNAPFFITRFREALFHYSTLFDMLETTLPSEIEERMLIEREMFGREAMNVIACEGAERIERPETYKQWQLRNMRAGFRQLPLNEEIKKMAKERVTEHYHKDFVIEEDSQWLLQGWKGRIVYALSSWTPAS